MADSNTIYVAKESFATTLDGEEIVVRKGVTRVRAGHSLLRGREAFFEPLSIQYDTEKATAAPAEVRASRPASKPESTAAPVKKATTKEGDK